MAQLALWTFDTITNEVSGSVLTPELDTVFGTPSFQLFFQDIDGNGKGGTGNTDSLGVVHAATSAAAWNDATGNGTDGEVHITFDGRGFTGLHLSFDFKGDNNAARGILSAEIHYSIDGGVTYVDVPGTLSLGAADGNFFHVNVDLSTIAALNNVPNIILKIDDFDSATHDPNNQATFDNVEIFGTALAAASNPPDISIDTANTTKLLNLTPTGEGFVNGALGDPTDPASTLGIHFLLANVEAGATFSVSSSNQSVVSNANAVLSVIDATHELLKITPTGAGHTDITFTVTNPSGHGSASYVVSYDASAAAPDAADTRYHFGSTDGSAAIAIDNNFFIDANDENQVLGVYDRSHSGLPVKTFDFTSVLNLPAGGQPKEMDIEDAVRIGNRIYWMGSHSNESDGTEAPNRDTIFSTDLTGTGATTNLAFVGKYGHLEADLIAWDHLNGDRFGFNTSAPGGLANSAPEQPNGFNIEGITVAPDNTTMWLGFRAPISGGDALIVPVTNLSGLVDTSAASGATFGTAILLDLGGRGIRSIESDGNGTYVILAGPSGGATGIAPANFALYTWDGNAAHAAVLHNADLNAIALATGGSPEGLIVPANITNASQIQVVIDNGDSDFYNIGVSTKDLADAPTLQKFASQLVTLGATTLDVSIDQAGAQADPANASPVIFNVTFSEGVSDFTTGDVTLSGTAGATTAIVSQTDSSHYTVTVSGMTQPGTVIATIGSGVAHDGVGIANSASTSTDNTVNYDNTLPAVQSIVRADSNPTSAGTAHYTVTFSEPVTGVDATDFALTTAGVAGASITGFSGLGTTYTVTVNTGSGDGTIRLDLVDDDSIRDGSNNALGGAGVGNGNFNSGQVYTVDHTVPSVTINQHGAQADPTSGSPIVFDVAFSEAVTGFDATDISLAGSTAGGALAASVVSAGNGTNYTVSVTGMTSGGDVVASVVAGAAQDAAGNVSAASTSADHTVTFAPATQPVPTDFNGDGFADVLWRNASGQVAIWGMNGAQITSDQSVGTPDASWHVAGVGDFGGDQHGDVLWRNDSGQVVLWQMNGSQIVSNQAVATPDASWHLSGVGDFDGDHKSDVLWENSSGQVVVWQMNGNQIVGNQAAGTLDASWHVQGVADFDGDGKSDVLWRNDSGQVVIWGMNGAHIVSNQSVATPDLSWHVRGTGDFDGDGKSDVLWQNNSGQVVVWQMNGNQIVSNTAVATVDASWHVQDVLDLNGDHHADVLWRNDSGQVVEWQMNGAQIVANQPIAVPGNDWTVATHHYDIL